MIASLFAFAGCALIGRALAEADPVIFCLGAVILAGVIAALTQDCLKADE